MLLPLAAPATVVCVIDDPRAVELSGLVTTPDGYASVVDSQWDTDTMLVIFFDQGCRVTRTVSYPTPARDPEDIAVAPDGTLWVADIGDNGEERATIALWRLPADGGAPVIHRLTYPDGPHDAEAMFFDTNGLPVIVTKTVGAAGLYTPTGPLQPDTAQGVPLRLVGSFTAPDDAGLLGSLVTGAAVSPDRTRVALRTYVQAYEWEVPAGTELSTAITTLPPSVTGLADPQGEALAYTPDGAAFLTVSDEAGPTTLNRYERTVGPTAAPTSPVVALPLPLVTGPRWATVAAVAAGAAGGVAALTLLGLLVARRRGRRRRRA